MKDKYGSALNVGDKVLIGRFCTGIIQSFEKIGDEETASIRNYDKDGPSILNIHVHPEKIVKYDWTDEALKEGKFDIPSDWGIFKTVYTDQYDGIMTWEDYAPDVDTFINDLLNIEYKLPYIYHFKKIYQKVGNGKDYYEKQFSIAPYNSMIKRKKERDIR